MDIALLIMLIGSVLTTWRRLVFIHRFKERQTTEYKVEQTNKEKIEP